MESDTDVQHLSVIWLSELTAAAALKSAVIENVRSIDTTN